MLLKNVCALALLAFCFASANTKVSIKKGDEVITTYTEPLSDDEITFKCVTKGIGLKTFDWYIGDEKVLSSETSSDSAPLVKKLEVEKHYKKKLKCVVTFEDARTNSAEVELLMTCKFTK